MLILTESCLQCQKLSPYKVRGAFSTPVCATRKRKGLVSATKAFLQLAATAAKCCHPEGDTHSLTPPVTPFLQAQNLSSKWIAPTDNMQPKSHDGFIKGFIYCQPGCDMIDDHTCTVRIFVQTSQSTHTQRAVKVTG